jgi:hypothetical protein
MAWVGGAIYLVGLLGKKLKLDDFFWSISFFPLSALLALAPFFIYISAYLLIKRYGKINQ